MTDGLSPPDDEPEAAGEAASPFARAMARLRLVRPNFRGTPLVTGVGVLIGVAALIGAVARMPLFATVVAVDGVVEGGSVATAAMLQGPPIVAAAAALAAALLGLIDDAGHHKEIKGLRGHLAALARGHLTTGLIKAVGGMAIAAAAVLFLAVVRRVQVLAGLPGPPGEPAWVLAVDILVLALCMNAFNLLDLRPGRALKAWLPVGAALWAAAWFGAAPDVRPGYLQPQLIAGLVVGLVLLPFDLREKLMLGDAGTMAMGALVGWSLIATMGLWVRVAAMVLLVLLHVATERVSLSSIIDSTPPLRWLDRLGRPPEPGLPLSA
jgi:UDP-N-acetylmuramyl pentapeptide phosphotransferase/UDP-N-acetylglucosamine-1-phosphate transferase